MGEKFKLNPFKIGSNLLIILTLWVFLHSNDVFKGCGSIRKKIASAVSGGVPHDSSSSGNIFSLDESYETNMDAPVKLSEQEKSFFDDVVQNMKFPELEAFVNSKTTKGEIIHSADSISNWFRLTNKYNEVFDSTDRLNSDGIIFFNISSNIPKHITLKFIFIDNWVDEMSQKYENMVDESAQFFELEGFMKESFTLSNWEKLIDGGMTGGELFALIKDQAPYDTAMIQTADGLQPIGYHSFMKGNKDAGILTFDKILPIDRNEVVFFK